MVVVTNNDIESNGGDALAVTGMGAEAQVSLTNNQLLRNAGAAVETDLTVDLLNSVLTGDTLVGNGDGTVILVDGSTAGGNNGFQNLAATAFSEYRVHGNVQMNGGTTFTIQPGVTVENDSNVQWNEYGTLVGVAPTGQAITVTSSSGQSNGWAGINNWGGTVTFTNASLTNAGQNWCRSGGYWGCYWYWGGAPLNVENGSVTLTNDHLTNSADGLMTDGGTIDIENSTLDNDTTGIASDNANSPLYLTVNNSDMSYNGSAGFSVGAQGGSTFTVTNDTVQSNGGTGINISVQGGSTVTVTNDTVQSNGGVGINVGGSGGGTTVNVAGNTVERNGSHGIAVNGMSSASLSMVAVTGNDIESNGGDALAVTGMGAEAQVSLTNNELLRNAGAALETDLTVDLLNSVLTGDTLVGNGDGTVILVDGSTAGGNNGFQNLAATAFSEYVVQGNLQMNGGTTFTIQPGVTVENNSNVQWNEYGTLVGVAPTGEAITITSSSGQSSGWAGINNWAAPSPSRTPR